MLLSRVLFSVWVSPPVPHGFLAGRMISKLSRQKACSVSNEQVRETSHPARGERLQRKGKKAVQRLVSQTLFRAICREEGTLAGDQELWVLALVFIAARRNEGRAVTKAGLGTWQPLRQESPRSPETQKRILSSNLCETGWEEA